MSEINLTEKVQLLEQRLQIAEAQIRRLHRLLGRRAQLMCPARPE